MGTGNSRSFAVVTDSTADIPAAVCEEQGITVVRLNVNFGGESMLDGDLTQPEFFARMKASPALPTTSQPSVGAFVEVYEELLKTADQIVSIHISNKLSGTVESATQAAERFDGRVHVFDSLTLSAEEAFFVDDAVESAKAGLTPEAAIERLEAMRDRTNMIVGFDTLENLSKGGRIGKVSAFLGTMLNVKVTLTVDDQGAFHPVARSRGEKAALEHTVNWVKEQMGQATSGKFFVLHAMSAERAHRIADEIAGLFPGSDISVREVGSVIAAHTGTAWGVALLPNE